MLVSFHFFLFRMKKKLGSVGAQFHAVTGSSSGLKISLAAELEADVDGVDPGAGPELDPGPEVIPGVSGPA